MTISLKTNLVHFSQPQHMLDGVYDLCWSRWCNKVNFSELYYQNILAFRISNSILKTRYECATNMKQSS